MNIWHSEFLQNYGTYTFGYGAYASIEAHDDLSSVYGQGFLPYSGSRDVLDVLYFARSARSDLPRFAPTSENRRILKRFDGLFTKQPISAKEWLASDACMSFSLSYFAGRHDAQVMPKERLGLILNHAVRPSGVRYEKDGNLVALVLFVDSPTHRHFWYSFYDLSLVEQSLGMWLMLDAARDAKEAGKQHFYVGTVYGEKALYKTNIPALSWWDGRRWRDDVETLKGRARSDKDRTVQAQDLWKEGTLF